jgi:phenylalanyl-tRNA synthetase alpha chain
MDLKKVKNFEELKKAKFYFYGPDGKLKKLQNDLKNTSNKNEKKIIGKEIHKIKQNMEILFKQKNDEIILKLMEEKINNEWVDVTEPLEQSSSLHPITLIEERARFWFIQNGYFETIGPEIETEEYNFEKLNIPKNHPARDMQDSLYINDELLMRTHNTGFSARSLELYKNEEFAEFAIGKVYRNDDDDQTHTHQFTQIDWICVGKISFANLIWTIKSLISYILETDVKIRLRPSFFPFTEPSTEVDIFYNNKWIEVLGAGIIHKNVLKSAGYTNDMNAFAAGCGIERLAMIKYEIDDIRYFYQNDIKFLNQFKEVN